MYKMQSSRWDATSETSVRTNTQQNLLMQRTVSIDCYSHSIEWWATDANFENSVGWQDPVTSEISSREQMIAQKGRCGRSIGVIQTASQNQRNPNAPTFEERSIEWTSSMKEKNKESSLVFFHKSGHKVPGSYSENRSRFFKPSPAINVSSPSFAASNESGFIVDPGASLHMMSKKWFDSRRAGTDTKVEGSISYYECTWNYLYGWRSNSICVCDLDMFVQTQLLKESPVVLSLGKLCEEMVTRLSGFQVRHHISSRMGEHRVWNRQRHSLGGSRRASDRTPDQSSGRPEAGTSCGRPRATCGNKITWMASTIHGRIDDGIFKFDIRLPSWRGHTTFPRILQQTLLSNRSGGKHA